MVRVSSNEKKLRFFYSTINGRDKDREEDDKGRETKKYGISKYKFDVNGKRRKCITRVEQRMETENKRRKREERGGVRE